MNIVMMTNTYDPIVGGLENSVRDFAAGYRQRGHRVLVVTPDHDDAPENEKGVFRVPAIQHFNGTDFSVELPISSELNRELERFSPDVIHTHHPFLIGDTALRAAAAFNVPIVFTHHTLYEQNTHYLIGDSNAMKRFVIRLSIGFANLCDHVIAPSQSVLKLLAKRGVTVPVSVVPTGIDTERFSSGDGGVFRKRWGVPKDAFVLGIVSRVAEEKNFLFLAQTAAMFLKEHSQSWFVIVGTGPSLDTVKHVFEEQGVAQRLICPGVLKDQTLVNAYTALDVFTFASYSETQGLVLVEAMAAGVPVVALNASGVREVVKDRQNGCLLPTQDVGQFLKALEWVKGLNSEERSRFHQEARNTAETFAVSGCIDRALMIYQQVIKEDSSVRKYHEHSVWKRALRVLRAQTELMGNLSNATGAAINPAAKKALVRARHQLKKALREFMFSE